MWSQHPRCWRRKIWSGIGRSGVPRRREWGREKEAQRTASLTFDWSSVNKTQKQSLLNPFQFCNECTFYPCSTLQVNGIRKPQTLPSIYIRRTLFLKLTMEGEYIFEEEGPKDLSTARMATREAIRYLCIYLALVDLCIERNYSLPLSPLLPSSLLYLVHGGWGDRRCRGRLGQAVPQRGVLVNNLVQLDNRRVHWLSLRNIASREKFKTLRCNTICS